MRITLLEVLIYGAIVCVIVSAGVHHITGKDYGRCLKSHTETYLAYEPWMPQGMHHMPRTRVICEQWEYPEGR